MKYEIYETRTVPTVKVKKHDTSFLLHSKYNPIKESEVWISSLKTEYVGLTEILVIGMGAGHHIREILKQFTKPKVIIVELNREYSNWISNSELIDDLLINPRIEYFSLVGKEEHNRFLELFDEHTIVHEPSLVLAEQQLRHLVDGIKNLKVKEKTIHKNKEKLQINFMRNTLLSDQGINNYNFPQKKAVLLISAGPSLSKQVSLLKSVDKERFFIACVGTAFIPLIKSGVIPDMVMISDSDDSIEEQFNIDHKVDIPLFYLSTANNNTIHRFKGHRYIVWQQGYPQAEKFAGLRSEPLIETGGSVATCLLDLLVVLGAKKIALVGQDLAFTSNLTHANDTSSQKKISNDYSYIEVENYYRTGKVFTARSLLIYLKWLSEYALRNINGLELWNCTEGGAYITNWKHEALEEFLRS